MGMVYTGSGEMGGYEYVPDDVPNQGAQTGALPTTTDSQGFYNPSGEFVSTAPALSDFSQALTGSSQTPSATQTTAPLSIQTTTPPTPVGLTPPPEVPTPPQEPNINYGGFTADQIKNFLDYNYGVGVDPVLNQRISDQMKERGIERYSPEQIQFAVDSLNRWNAVGDIRQQQGMARGNPWEDPNWRTIEALKRAAQEKERVQVANTPSPYTVGPGPAATPQNLTLDPMYAQLIGSADPKAVLRAINAGTLKPGALPADIAAKLFPSGGTFPSETKKSTAVTTPAVTTTGGTTTPLTTVTPLTTTTTPTTTGTTTTPTKTTTAPTTTTAPVSTADTTKTAITTDTTTPAITTDTTKTTTPTQITSGVQVADYQGNKFDTGQTLNLAKQIAGVFDTKNSSGGVFATKGEGVGFDYDTAKKIVGSDPTVGQQVALDVSRYLQQKGVTDLGQIGIREADVLVGGGGESGADERYEKQKEFYNKETGKAIAPAGSSGYIGETYTGKGVTTYMLTERPDGSVGVKTVGGDTSDAGMIMPLLSAASMLFLPGITQTLSGALTGTFGSASNIVASGLVNGVTSGVIAELGGGNFGDGFVKGALGGAAGTAAGAALNTYLPTDMNSSIRTGLISAGTSAARAIATGGDVETAIANGLMSGAASGALSMAGQAVGMDAKTAIATARTLAPIVLSLAKTGGVSEQTIMNAVMSAGATLIGNTKPGTVKEEATGKKAGGAITKDDLEFDAYAKAKRLGASDDEAMGLLRPAKRYDDGGSVWGDDGGDGLSFSFDGGGFDTPAVDISFDTPIQMDSDVTTGDLSRLDRQVDNLATSVANMLPGATQDDIDSLKRPAIEYISKGGDAYDADAFDRWLKGVEMGAVTGNEPQLEDVEVRGRAERSEDLSTGLIVPTELDNETTDAVFDPVTITAARENDGVSTDLSTGLTTATEQDEDRRLDCAEGYHEENGICVADDDTKKPPVECPEGYIYNFNTQSCEKVTTTPPPPPKTSTTTAAKTTPSGSSNVSISTPPVTQPTWLNLQSLSTGAAGERFQDPLERVMSLASKLGLATPSQSGLDPFLQQILAQRAERPFYRYGQEPSIDAMLNPQRQYADGGYVAPLMAMGGMALPLLAKQGGLTQYGGREDFKDGKHVAGDGDGQSDDIPAWLADGEFVFPADVVSALGNGSTKAGTDKLYEMMHNIRSHARSSGPKDLPPPAKKSPLDYLSKKK